MSEKKETTCKDINCRAAHVHYEQAANGNTIASFRIRASGTWHLALPYIGSADPQFYRWLPLLDNLPLQVLLHLPDLQPLTRMTNASTKNTKQVLKESANTASSPLHYLRILESKLDRLLKLLEEICHADESSGDDDASSVDSQVDETG